MIWSEKSLFYKAMEYLQRAHSLDRKSDLFPFWASLSLEFLSRACLSRVHPVLLADPQLEDSLLYAFGHPASRNPKLKSIAIGRVLDRCVAVIPNFTSEELEFAMLIVGLRNEELHSGLSPFSRLSPDRWQAEFYRVCEILLEFLGKSLTDVLDQDDAAAAGTMIVRANDLMKKDVLKRIGTKRKTFEELPGNERAKLFNEGIEMARQTDDQWTTCPACQGPSWLESKVVKSLEPRLEGNVLWVETVLLPTGMHCIVCGLELHGYDELRIAERGGQLTVKEVEDLIEWPARNEDL